MPYKDYEQQKANARENYYKNRKKRLAQAKLYYKNNRRKRDAQKKEWRQKNIEKAKLYQKKWNNTKEGKESLARSAKKYREKNRKKTAAHYAVHNALRRGDLIKPDKCQKCSKKRKLLHAHHHKGYKKQFHLTVLWLCPGCHKKEHYGQVDRLAKRA